MFNLMEWLEIRLSWSLHIRNQDTCGVSVIFDFSEKEKSTLRNKHSIHFQASCPYHYKRLSLGSSSASVSVSG